MKAINITDQASYKLKLNSNVWVGSTNGNRDPDWLASAHKCWGIESIFPLVRSELIQKGAAIGSASYSNVVDRALTGDMAIDNARIPTQYKFDMDFTMSEYEANLFVSTALVWGMENSNQRAANWKHDASDTRYAWHAGMYEADEMTLTKIQDEAPLAAAPTAELLPTIVFPANAIGTEYAHADGNTFTVSGAFTVTDGVQSAVVNPAALICYVPLGPIGDATGLTSLTVDAKLAQSIDSNIVGLALGSDGKLAMNGSTLYVVLGDLTGAGQLTDLTGTTGTGFALSSAADGAPLAPGIRVVTFTAYDSYGDGWNGAGNTIEVKDATDAVVFNVSAALLATATKPVDGGVSISAFLASGTYTVTGVCNSYPTESTYDVTCEGVTLIGGQATAEEANKVYVPFTTPNVFTVTAYDSYGDGWNGAGPSLVISDSSGGVVYTMDPTILAGAKKAVDGGSSASWSSVAGTYSVLAINSSYPEESSYKIFDAAGAELHAGASAKAADAVATTFTIA